MDQPAKTKIAAIVIPTFNEAGSIARLIKSILQLKPSIPGSWQLKVIVVDAHSSDDTQDIVKNLMALNEGAVYLVAEEKREGIGAAYMKGFRYAMDMLDADALIEFDGDLQHEPELIPALLAKMDEGYDYVLGSRMIEGGSDNDRKSFMRKSFTSAGSLIARSILFSPHKNFAHVTDPTTGLKATRVKGYADRLNMDAAHLYSRGFGYKVQLLSETLALGPRYAEVPLTFKSRQQGQSKFSWGTPAEVLYACVRSRLASKA